MSIGTHITKLNHIIILVFSASPIQRGEEQRRSHDPPPAESILSPLESNCDFRLCPLSGLGVSCQNAMQHGQQTCTVGKMSMDMGSIRRIALSNL